MPDELKLTPTQDLILDVLIARRRLGERLWTFDATHRRAVEKLEQLGLVTWKHGVVEKTVMVWPTDKAVELYMSATYVAPGALADVPDVLRALALLREADEVTHPDGSPASAWLRHLAERPDLVRKAMSKPGTHTD